MASDDFSRFILPGSHVQVVLLDVGVEMVGCLGLRRVDDVGDSDDIILGVLGCLLELARCSI